MNTLAPVGAAFAVLALLALSMDHWQTLGLSLQATSWLGFVYVLLIHLLPVVVYAVLFSRVESFSKRLGLALLPITAWWCTEIGMRRILGSV